MKSPEAKPMELVCPAGTPAALRAAAEAGADAIYCGLANETNARNFPGLNFSPEELAEGVAFAHRKGSRVLVAINTFARAGDVGLWREAVDTAAQCRADAVIAADLAVLDHAASNHPALRLHLSVQAAANTPEAIRFYADTFGVKRVVLPRVLSVPEIASLNKEINVETEVFVFGGLCVMTEGRCSLSSYATGKSPNLTGVCSPPEHVDYTEDADGKLQARLGGFTIDSFEQGQAAGYPTLCKGQFTAEGKTGYLFEDPVSLNAFELLGDLSKAGVTALKIEGRQRGKAYIAGVVGAFRKAVDSLSDGADPGPAIGALKAFSEGGRQTAGSYKKTWRQMMPDSPKIELALGPCFFNWSAERLVDFYRRIAEEADIDRVYLGEVVCGKRMPFTDAIWPDIMEMLTKAGKQVVLSGLAQPVNKREREILRQQAGYDMPIEINDLSMVPGRAGQEFTAGPFLNVYNEASLRLLADRGATAWCPPVELPLVSIQKIAALVPEVDIELFAFGRLPLALSSRCYHARAHGLRKDACQFVCDRDPDGMNIATLDDRRFLAANGIQTLSDAVHVAGVTSGQLQATGIRRLRLSPHSLDMVKVAGTFRRFLDGELTCEDLNAELAGQGLPGPVCNAYLAGDAGWKTATLPA